MAHFRGELQGFHGEATRLGNEKSGLRTTANGWDFGVQVRMRYNRDTDEDEATIELTGGSNAGATNRTLGTFTRKDLEQK